MTKSMEILEGLARGNYHHEDGIRALYLGPLDQEFMADLKKEAKNIVHARQPSVVKQGQHVTGWTRPKGQVEQWSLFNTHGRTEDTSNDFSYNLKGKKPIRMPRSPNIAALCKLPALVNMRLNVIHPGSGLSPHEEHLPRRIGHNKVSMRARFHIPLWTNNECHMLADNNLYHFEEGELYLFNNGCVHSATNDGNTARAHLVFDMLMTSEAMEKMFGHIDLKHNAYLTDTHKKVGESDITEWAPSNGMSEKEFTARKLVVHP